MAVRKPLKAVAASYDADGFATATPTAFRELEATDTIPVANIPDLAQSKITNLAADLAAKVPQTRTINGADLSANRTFTQDDFADGTTNKAFTATEKTKLGGIEASADVTDAANVGSSIHGVAAKTTPVDADSVPLIDSEASNVLKKLSWTNIKAFLKTYFDTLYLALTGDQTIAGVKTFSSSPIVPAPTTDLQAATKKYVDDNAGGGGIGGATGSTDNAVLRADGTGGATLQASSVTIEDGGNLNVAGRIIVSGGGNYIAFGDVQFGDVIGTGAATFGYNSSAGIILRDNTDLRTHLVGGAAVASAATITPTGTLFHITGTTTISTINATISGFNMKTGQEITMIFDASLTVTNGSGLMLAGAANFSATADDTLTLVWDGTKWREKCRSVN